MHQCIVIKTMREGMIPQGGPRHLFVLCEEIQTKRLSGGTVPRANLYEEQHLNTVPRGVNQASKASEPRHLIFCYVNNIGLTLVVIRSSNMHSNISPRNLHVPMKQL